MGLKKEDKIVDSGKVSYLEMLAFFDSLGKIIDGSYRRLTMDFRSKAGDCYTATAYQSRVGSSSRKFVRIDIKKSDLKPIGNF